MGLDDILFSYDDQQNFVMELPVGILNAPVDILFETGTNPGIPCLEAPLIEIPYDLIPDVILLSDGKLAKRVSNKFYLKL
jgi:hypothetical protein